MEIKIITYLSLIFFCISCNSEQAQQNNSKHKIDSPHISDSTITTIEDLPTKDVLPKDTIVYPENVCLDWSFGDEMGISFVLVTDCIPVDSVFHLMDTSKHSAHTYSEILTGQDFSYQNPSGKGLRSFKIIFYHRNGQKSFEMDVKSGSRRGIYAMYNEQGDTIIHRDYSNSNSIISYKEIDSYLWICTYDSSAKAIRLNLPAEDIKEVGGKANIKLTCLNGEFEELYSWGWDYEEPLLVNDSLFTGTLEGYNPEFMGHVFSVDFKDGWAHGDFYWREDLEDGEILFMATYENGVFKDTVEYIEHY